MKYMYGKTAKIRFGIFKILSFSLRPGKSQFIRAEPDYV